jgi:hypothetical protein
MLCTDLVLFRNCEFFGGGLQAGCTGGVHAPDMPHAGQEARMTADREVDATYLRIGS